MPGRKPKLCLISTGGTISMVRDRGGLAGPAETSDLSHLLSQSVRDQYELNSINLFNFDSTNIGPAEWTQLVEFIDESWNETYDGYVVLHGTDTMAYTAAAVAFGLGVPPLHYPVVFTGAQRTPDAQDFDGIHNFESACRVAASDLGEVCVVFHGKIFRGCRVDKVSATALDAFRSPKTEVIGDIQTELRLCPEALGRKEPWFPPILPEPVYSDRVASIAINPGQRPEMFEGLLAPSTECEGITIQTLGAGHLPDRETYNWLLFVERAVERGIPVLMLSPFVGGRTDQSGYALGKAAIDAGGIAVPGLSRSAAEVRFRHLLSMGVSDEDNVVQEIREWFETNYFGEQGGVPQLPEFEDE